MFFPIDIAWQNFNCNKLRITFVAQSYNFNTLRANLHSLQPNSLRKIIGDGNCFYRSLSYVISGCENNHSKIRQEISQALELHLPINCNTIIDHVNNSRKDRQWAEAIDILAASHFF